MRTRSEPISMHERAGIIHQVAQSGTWRKKIGKITVTISRVQRPQGSRICWAKDENNRLCTGERATVVDAIHELNRLIGISRSGISTDAMLPQHGKGPVSSAKQAAGPVQEQLSL